MKPFLHQATIDKMRIFGSDKEEWTAALQEEIEADSLPVHYGGTMVDPDGDPKCPSKVKIKVHLNFRRPSHSLCLLFQVQHGCRSSLFVLHE